MMAVAGMVVALVLASGATALAEDVSMCGQTVKDGVLVADLDCSGSMFGVAVLDGGTLDLAGHTLVGGSRTAIGCERRCSIEGGGGTVTGTGSWGVSSTARGSVLRLSNLELVSGTPHAMFYGVMADKVELTGATISGPGVGVNARREVVLVNSGITGTLDAISSTKRIRIEGSTLTGNEWPTGYFSKRIDVSGSTISGNAVNGLRGKRVEATSSIIDGNGGGAHCTTSPQDCADILSARRPVLTSVTCSTSAELDPVGGGNYAPSGSSWGACALD